MTVPPSKTADTGGLAITYRRLDDIIPADRNPRTHSREQIVLVENSLARFGWATPIGVADGKLIYGHARRQAAINLRNRGIAIPGHPDPNTAPVVDLSRLSAAERRAYLIADNQLATTAGWDSGLLKAEMIDLKELGFDLSLTGFSQLDVLSILGGGAGNSDADEDSIPPTPDNPITRPGDIWVMGDHRLMCGDATDPANIERLTAGRRAELCFTSPPYSQQRNYTTGGISNWDTLMQGVFANLPMAPSAQVLVNLGLVHEKGEWQPYWNGWIEWMRTIGWRRFGFYVWDQLHGLPGDWNGRLAPAHEFVFHFNHAPEGGDKAQHRPNKTKDKSSKGISKSTGLRNKEGNKERLSSPGSMLQTRRIPDSIIRAPRNVMQAEHPAMFSVAFASEIIAAFSLQGQIVFEPFSGSGTTIIAAETLDRHALAIDIAPAYVDVAVKRWEMHTGMKARREAPIQPKRRPARPQRPAETEVVTAAAE